jgi:hypothetical protein
MHQLLYQCEPLNFAHTVYIGGSFNSHDEHPLLLPRSVNRPVHVTGSVAVYSDTITNSRQQSAFFLNVTILQLVTKFSVFLRNLKAHYRLHNSPSLVPILSQTKPVHVLTTDFFNTQFNIIL